MNKPLIYLASQSPRRRELLQQIGVAHKTLSIEIDETPLPAEQPQAYVTRMALEKARAGLASLSVVDLPVLGADTTVVIDGAILGKPNDENDARLMLQSLAARTHQVVSAVALVNEAGERSCLNVSRVTFREISDEEARGYWLSGEPRDKAGGYGIQGMGAVFIERLEGSYSGVMGLPLFETARLLQGFGVQTRMALT